MKKYVVDTKYGKYIVEATDEQSAAKIGYKKSLNDAVSVEQFRRITSLMRAVRSAINSEFSAINEYEEIAALAADLGYDKIAKLMNDIRNEERQHVGELVAALSEIDGKDGESFNSGVEEANDILKSSAQPDMNQSPIEETAVEDEQEVSSTTSLDIEKLRDKVGATYCAAGTYNDEPVYFLSFNSQEAQDAAQKILKDEGVTILQVTLNPIAKLFMLTIAQR